MADAHGNTKIEVIPQCTKNLSRRKNGGVADGECDEAVDLSRPGRVA